MQKNHRTALVIDGRNPEAKSDYKERVRRLLESVNGPNIKVDVYTLTTTGLVEGLHLEAPAPAQDLTFSDVVAQAKAAGYTQVLIDTPAV